MNAEDFMTRTLCNDLSREVRYYLYSLICLQNATQVDIDTYLEYEGEGDKWRKRLILETIDACKVFKVTCGMLKEDCPKPQDVEIILTTEAMRVNPKVLIRKIDRTVTI